MIRGSAGARIRGPRLARGLAALVFLPVLLACGEGGSGLVEGEEETISRQTFVSTYVDLRLAALRDSAASISAEERERVLEAHGVSREDLLRFVEVHGDRVRFMQEIWNEVDERIRRARDGGDTTRG